MKDTPALLASILSAYREIAAETLLNRHSFTRRARMLERLEFEVFDALAAVEPSPDPGSPRSLSARAQRLRRRLEAMDEAECAGLRRQIREGLHGPALEARLRDTVEEGRLLPLDEPGYDDLDLLVNGILLTERLPSASRIPEPEMVFYQQTPVRVIFKLLQRAEPNDADHLYDFGSGLGHVPILANLLTGVRATGLEVEPAYRDYSLLRAAELGIERIRFDTTDVRDADLGAGTIFFMFTPFRGRMLEAVLRKLEMLARERPVRLFTYGPCTHVVGRAAWLRPIHRSALVTDALAEFRGGPFIEEPSRNAVSTAAST